MPYAQKEAGFNHHLCLWIIKSLKVTKIIPKVAAEKARGDFVNDKVCVRINFCSE